MNKPPAIPQEEHAERRRRFQEQLGEGVALVAGALAVRRSHDVEYPFRQRSDLLYLTGWPQPDAMALLTRDRFVLFVQPRDPAAETWTGRRPGVEGAVSAFGADEAYPRDELPERLPGFLENRSRLFHAVGADPHVDALVTRALEQVRGRVRAGVSAPAEIVDPRVLLHEMRLHKSARELEIMRAAADISREAHRAAARACRPGAHEYELQAELEHVFRRRGGDGPAYPCIVGSGENATVLHYVENRDALRPGELCLIDAGVELHGYASDVTRTYPVGGRFQGAARDVYEVVLEAQTRALESIGPGSTLRSAHERAVRTLCEGLLALGALEGDLEELVASEAYKPFYMHSTGHFLGIDVHDVGAYHVDGKPRPLEPGIVFTCEPGLYFSEREERTPARLRGIGVRIEDDVVFHGDGIEVLTREIPKRIDDVEAWMRS